MKICMNVVLLEDISDLYFLIYHLDNKNMAAV